MSQRTEAKAERVTERIIAADIGATKTLIGIFEGPPGSPQEVVAERLENAAHPDFGDLLSDFLQRHGAADVDAACIAFPGPVDDGRAQGTNIAWAVDRRDLAAQLGTARVQVVNDLVAAARGMLLLPETAFMALNPGADAAASGNAAVLSVGTGLGQAILHWDEDRFRPIACEGSHADFAAQSEQEIALLRYMQARHGTHVSWERVVSGPGLVDIHAFLRDGAADGPGAPVAAAGGDDPAAAISAAALQGGDPLCRAAVTLFCRLMGAEAGNLALKCLAVGGVYIGGGIPPQILPALQDGAFLSGFREKGRFRGLMSRIPVRVALEPRAGLLGAARIATGLPTA
ncbi:glucokinase [Marinibaculum pumilum]|uniref:Glucokinase n=1 Tax=Marinibaculum pumilum TaxID=1766165 RepID=A0ABV7L7M8_9PROT